MDFNKYRNQRDEGFQHDDNFSDKGIVRDFEYRDSLEKFFGSTKIKIIAFQGRNDPDAYLGERKRLS
jgi:hypothetical protein